GGKSGHWIWYIFPQLTGLGSSAPAMEYGIAGLPEATRYLEHPVLGPRLLEITRVVADQLHAGTPIGVLMGSRIDVLELVPSLTLFGHVAAEVARRGGHPLDAEFAQVAGDVLSAARAQGYPPCAFTLAAIRRATP